VLRVTGSDATLAAALRSFLLYVSTRFTLDRPWRDRAHWHTHGARIGRRREHRVRWEAGAPWPDFWLRFVVGPAFLPCAGDRVLSGDHSTGYVRGPAHRGQRVPHYPTYLDWVDIRSEYRFICDALLVDDQIPGRSPEAQPNPRPSARECHLPQNGVVLEEGTLSARGERRPRHADLNSKRRAPSSHDTVRREDVPGRGHHSRRCQPTRGRHSSTTPRRT